MGQNNLRVKNSLWVKDLKSNFGFSKMVLVYQNPDDLIKPENSHNPENPLKFGLTKIPENS